MFKETWDDAVFELRSMKVLEKEMLERERIELGPIIAKNVIDSEIDSEKGRLRTPSFIVQAWGAM